LTWLGGRLTGLSSCLNLDLIWASAAYALRKVANDDARTLEDRLHTI
jgi:hypothetical protein